METPEQIALRVADEINADGGEIGETTAIEFSRRLVAELTKQQEPFGYVYPEISRAFKASSCWTVYKNFLRGRIPLYLHPQSTPQEVKDAAREEVHNVRKANIDCVDHFNAAMQDLAAQQLVIQQMRAALLLPCDRWNGPQTLIVNQALAIQPSTEALDAYVAEKVKEARAQALFDAADDFEAGASADDIRSNAAAIRARSDKENGE